MFRPYKLCALWALALTWAFFSVPAASQDKPSLLNSAWTDAELHRAAGELRRDTSIEGRLNYAIYLHVLGGPNKRRELEGILLELDKHIDQNLDAIQKKRPLRYENLVYILDARAYDGSDKSIAEYIMWASQSRDLYNGINVPCAFVYRSPGLIAALEPRYGDRRDIHLPTTDCFDHPYLKSLQYPVNPYIIFDREITKADGNFLDNHPGSLVHTHAIRQELSHLRLLLAHYEPRPEQTIKGEPGQLYENWASLSLSNKKQYERINAAAQTFRRGLAAYYDRLGVSPERKEAALRYGLHALTWGDCTLPDGLQLRMLVTHGGTRRDIEEALLALRRNPPAEKARDSCLYFAGKDPLIHIALARPDLLAFLKKELETFTPQEREKYDLVYDLEARNAFGKTPLMTAAQHDLLHAAKFLLARGANVRAVTDAEGLTHNRRTPLMYAAASGSRAMIRLLLDAGADPAARDSQGKTALDYMQGAIEGAEPNPLLSESEKAVVMTWLKLQE